MARFCARIRQIPGMSNVSMRDIYMNPTIAKLAAHLDHAAIEGFVAAQRRSRSTFPPTSSYYGCGALQLAVLRRLRAVRPLGARHRLSMGRCRGRRAARALCAQRRVRGRLVRRADRASPIAAKWLLIGRFKAQVDPDLEPALFPLLGRQDPDAHVRRWWRFTGTPIYNVYLRLMGAKIGRNVVDRLPLRPGLRRPGLDRRQHDPAQGHRSCSAIARSRTSSTSARSRSAATPSSAKRA